MDSNLYCAFKLFCESVAVCVCVCQTRFWDVLMPPPRDPWLRCFISFSC